MTTENENTNRPTHTINTVIGDGAKARFVKIGVCWPNRDGKGFNLVFDALPYTGRTVMREITGKESDAATD